MHAITTTLSLLVSALAATTALAAPLDARAATDFPNPQACTGNCSGVHDPAVVRASDGTWWRLSTNGNIALASAPDLTGPWTYHGAMLPEGSKIHVADDQQLWAPDVSLLDGTYYAYYAVSTLGSQASDIGVASSTTLAPGSWTDHGSLGIPKSKDYNLIDPNFFREAPELPIYFGFGSAWNAIYQTELAGSYVAQQPGVGETNIVFNATHPTSSDASNMPAIAEGSYMFWWPVDGVKYYFMFFSSGACCQPSDKLAAPGDEYKVMVCRATTPTGPFVDQAGKNCLTENGGTLVLGSHGNVYAPGGQGVLADASLPLPVLYYHYVDPTVGYDYDQFLFGFNYIDFASGWPVVTADPVKTKVKRCAW